MKKNNTYEPIAVVGMGCRFPGGINNPSDYWKVLENGIDAISDVPKDRWNHEYYYSDDRTEEGSIISPQGGFIDNVKCFDYSFFGISANEANSMDPQQRIALQVVWESFEQGGIDISKWSDKLVGVFMGSFTADYQFIQQLEPLDYSVYTPTGMTNTMLSNRISHTFNFKGPSMSIDTACSASLTSIHQACRSLQMGDSDLAVSGGSMLMLVPDFQIGETKTGFLSKTGRCHSFSENADGYVRSEGVGIVVLKRLKDAIKDNDQIQSVIIGSAINQDGATHGIALPNGSSQKAAMHQAFKNASIRPSMVSFVEAHGTGTTVGDPIEANSIGEIYGLSRPKDCPLYIGSCKSNIGHTESAAGVAGLIKAILCLQNEAIPKNLHSQPLNSNIPFDKLNLHVPTEKIDLSGVSERLIGGVNSFGYGGSNGHILIEKFSKASSLNTKTPKKNGNMLCLPVSANSEESFKKMVSNYLSVLKNESGENLCYTSANHRAHLNYRKLFFAENKNELATKLENLLQSPTNESFTPVSTKKLFWVFSGLGGTTYGSSKELYEKEPIFRYTYDNCNRVYEEVSGLSMMDIFNNENADRLIIEYHHLQIAITFHQISLIALYKSYGIEPKGIVGHSAGEFAAFYAAGVYTLKETFQLIHHRVNRVKKIDNSGGMISIKGDLPISLPLIKKYNGKLSVAAYNSSNSISVSGHKDALNNLLSDLNINKIPYKELPSNKAYHHKGMYSGLDNDASLPLDIIPKPTKIKLYSSITGTEVDVSKLEKNYWPESLKRPVIFHSTIEKILKDEISNCLFLELSDKPVLFHHVRNIIKGSRASIANKVRDGFHQHLYTISSLYESGINLNWNKLINKGSFIQLKTYPWVKSEAWHESEKSKTRRLMPFASPLLGTRLIEQDNQWESKWTTTKLSWLNQHKILGDYLLPGATYVELALSALNQLQPDAQFVLENLTFEKAARLSYKASFFTKVSLDTREKRITIYATEKLYPKNFSMVARVNYRKIPKNYGISKNIRNLIDHTKIIDGSLLYDLLSKSKYKYGSDFQGIRSFVTSGTSSICKIQVEPKFCDSAYALHPVVLDIAFHSALACRYNSEGKSIPFQIPVELGEISVYCKPSTNMIATARLTHENSTHSEFNISLFSDNGQMVASIRKFKTQSLTKSQEESKFQSDIKRFQSTLDWEPSELKDNDVSIKNDITFIVGSASLKKRIEKIILPLNNNISVHYFKSNKRQSLHSKTKAMHVLFKQIPTDAIVINCLALESKSKNDVVSKICDSTIALSRTIRDLKFNGKVWFISENAQSLEQETYNPFQNVLWGMSRVFCNQEHPENSGGIADIESKNDLKHLLTLVSSKTIENQFALRQGKWHKLRLNAISKSLQTNAPITFGKHSPYLVTGAFGSIGKQVIKWMHAKGARHFILTTSKPFLENESSHRSEFVTKLERLGAKIKIATVDLCNAESLALLKNEIPLDDIAGVVYSAGSVDDKTLVNLDRKSLNKVVNTKLIGAWSLHTLFKNTNLEHFILFSSVGSCFPNRGMSNYAAGNAALDALAHYRKRQGLPALSINWGAWKTGMVAKLDLEKHLKKLGIDALKNDEGIASLESLFFSEAAQVIVQKVDWPKFLSYQKNGASIFENFRHSETSSSKEAKVKKSKSNIKQRLQEELADLLAMDQSEIDYTTNLIDYNIDSLSIVVMSELIRTEYGVNISIESLKDNMSIMDINEYIDSLNF